MLLPLPQLLPLLPPLEGLLPPGGPPNGSSLWYPSWCSPSKELDLPDFDILCEGPDFPRPRLNTDKIRILMLSVFLNPLNIRSTIDISISHWRKSWLRQIKGQLNSQCPSHWLIKTLWNQLWKNTWILLNLLPYVFFKCATGSAILSCSEPAQVSCANTQVLRMCRKAYSSTVLDIAQPCWHP